MHKVVSNTTPIIALLKINKLSVLKELYGTIYIPHAVYSEIEEGKYKFYYRNLNSEPWIIIEEIDVDQIKEILFDLDKGEAEAIVLARKIIAGLILMDEKAGRQYAKQLKLSVAGTIGVLLKAKENGLIESVKACLLELIDKGIYIKQSLLNKALQPAGEK